MSLTPTSNRPEAPGLDLALPASPLFSSLRSAPRRRRPTDVVRLVIAATTFVLLVWGASHAPPIDERVALLFVGSRGWLRTLAWAGFSFAGMTAVVVVAVAVFGGGRRGVLRDLIVASSLVAFAGLIAARLATDSWPNLIPELNRSTDWPAFPTMRVAFVVVVAGVLATYVTYPVQHLLGWMVVAAVAPPFVLGLTTPTALFGAVALGTASVAAVRVMFGSPEGLPPPVHLGDALTRVGVQADDLHYLPDQPGTVGLATAMAADGRRMSLKVYGRDAARMMRAERVWNALWYRTPGPAPRASRVELAQNEALALLTARQAGVAVPELVGTVQDEGGDVLLVTKEPTGTNLAGFNIDAVDDRTLSVIWEELEALHQHARVAHGWISPQAILVADERVSFTNFAYSSTMPTDQQLAADVVSLLVLTASMVGEDRAIAAAVDVVDPNRLVAALPYLQEAVVEPELRQSAKRAGVGYEELRAGLAGRLDVDAPEVAPVRRVTWSDLVMVALAIVAANALIAQIVDVGLESLLDSLRTVSVGWLVVAFGIRLAAYTTNYIGLRAVVTQPVPFGPTTLLQPAKGFVGLVVPSIVGRVGMDIRFLQKLGVPIATAATLGPIIGAIGMLTEFSLLLLSAWWLGQAVDASDLVAFDAGGLILVAVAVVIIGLIVVFAMPRFREKLIPIIREAYHATKSIVTSPVRFGQIALSEASRRILGAMALGATTAAFGVHVSFAALIFVTIGTGLLAGLAPVPGGIGVAEATMSGLLIGVGVDPALSITIALTYRFLTAYLPPLLGYFSMKWLTKEGYL